MELWVQTLTKVLLAPAAWFGLLSRSLLNIAPTVTCAYRKTRRQDTTSMHPAELQYYPTPPYYFPGCDVLFSFTYDPLLGVRMGSSSFCAATPLHWSLYFYGMGQRFGMSILSMYQVNCHFPPCKPWETELNPYQSIHMITLRFVTGLIPLDCLAASSLPRRPQFWLSPFWSSLPAFVLLQLYSVKSTLENSEWC